jgi:hypothetical protein
MRRLLAIVAALVLSACAHTPAPHSQSAVLDALSNALDDQYHACVPLGWNPVVVAGTYYPGYIASLQSYEEVWDAIWRGRIPASDVAKPRVGTVYDVLNHLVKAGLLLRKRTPSDYDYYLTYRALPYYYDRSWYGNNNGNMQYLCYSKVVPSRIISLQRIRRPSDWTGPAQWYRASFAWAAGAPARWARDPFLRAHSVLLSPMRSPATAKMFYADKTWHVADIDDKTWRLPKVFDAAAWSSP